MLGLMKHAVVCKYLKAALYGIFVGRWQHTCPKIGGNMSSIDKTGSVDYRSPRKK